MHGLAIELKNMGHEVSGSDDEIFEPSQTRLQKAGLLPPAAGWFPDRISGELDMVVAGMHAKADNPELLRAKELGLKVVSFPELVYEHARHKQRIVIGGSHGKTTITSMIIHVMRYWNRDVDFLVGAEVPGYGNSVRLTETAPVMVIEGDEYVTSASDNRPKFWHYQHHIGVISGIAWDHFNIYPSTETYQEVFKVFAERTPKAGTLFWNGDDTQLAEMMKHIIMSADVASIPYQAHKHQIGPNGQTALISSEKEKIQVQVFGRHNMENLQAALLVCQKVGISPAEFYQAIQSFQGAALRLQLVGSFQNTRVFRDYAHSPSKVAATVQSVRKQFPAQKLVACYELHTYSSLNPAFLPHYARTLHEAEVAAVYFNPHAVALKRMEPLTASQIKAAFARHDLLVFDDSEQLQEWLTDREWNGHNLLLMSSGNFNGLSIEALTSTIHKQLANV